MGTDNLFHKRREKKLTDLKRHAAKRETYAKILIVCEGEKTEPNYFTGARDHYRLNTANVEICGECGSDPRSVVTYAKQRYREERDAGDPFNKVYCVFDKDSHAGYSPALNELASAAPKGTFIAINSIPCFEYWLLLHFTYTTKPYNALPDKSTGDQVLQDLKVYMPDYEKGQQDVFAALRDQLDYAKANAERSLKAAKANGTDNPSTRVHELVAFMQGIKPQ
ncbi:MAG: RloB family protein [Gammaproteobacteria bacterium]